MMHRSRRAAICAALTGFLAAGAITVGATAASANTAGFCSAASTSTVKAHCTVLKTIGNPARIWYTVAMTSGANQDVSVNWIAECTLSGDTQRNVGGSTAMTPTGKEFLAIPFPTPPDSCDITVTATLGTNSGAMQLVVSYAPNPDVSSPSPAPSGPVRLYKGFGGKCVDDKGNSSADRTKVIIWTCNSQDKAQQWTYSGGKLMHNGKCLNDQRSGGNGSKVILYTCNGGANEIWTHKSNGEFVLKANGGKYCLDDPASSTHNGTQLIVWACKNTTNQHWFASTVS
jgi:Ricin-type beta-trefoil lectin domain